MEERMVIVISVFYITKARLTANHIQSTFRCIRQHIELLLRVNIHRQIVDQFLSILDEDWNESLEDFEVERVV